MKSLYRKYRPNTFEDLMGQDHIKKYFKNAVKKNSISHGYIFTGPRGTGKTTTARLLAKVVNCLNIKEFNPCNECENCREINSNSFMDVIELDAASNRGIDEIRQIRESANYKPVSGKFKVYIIDEFHMLTREAFNALLKTLEEPPSHVIFILATTNLEKVPDTIISRTQLINFSNIGFDEILSTIKEVCEKEGYRYEEKALEQIALKAKGGMRDALSLLEQVMKFSEEKIYLKDVLNVLGIFDKTYINDFINYLYSGDLDKILEISEEIFHSGKDYEILLEESLEQIFDMVKSNRSKNSDKIIYIMNKINTLNKELKYADNKRLNFDVGIVSLAFELKITKNTGQKLDKEEILKHLETDHAEDEAEKSSEDIISKLLEYFSQNESKKLNLGLYYAIKMAKKSLENDKLIFLFDEKSIIEMYLIEKYLKELKVITAILSKDSIEILLKKTFSIPNSKEGNIIKEDNSKKLW